MGSWSAASSWSQDGLRREVFFFDSGSDRIYASLYAAAPSTLHLQLVVCPPWGFELFEFYQLCHLVAQRVAEMGGAALLFHPPGHGDSTGEIESLTIPRTVEVALEAARQGEIRTGNGGWDFLGIRLGASTALFAAQAAGAQLLTLVLPPLDLREYLDDLRRTARRATLGRASAQAVVFGHPIPVKALEDPDHDIMGALGRFPGWAAVVRTPSDRPRDVPENVRDITVAVELSMPAKPDEQRRLAAATTAWLEETGRRRSAGAA